MPLTEVVFLAGVVYVEGLLFVLGDAAGGRLSSGAVE
jgi:hypothetical protein